MVNGAEAENVTSPKRQFVAAIKDLKINGNDPRTRSQRPILGSFYNTPAQDSQYLGIYDAVATDERNIDNIFHMHESYEQSKGIEGNNQMENWKQVCDEAFSTQSDFVVSDEPNYNDGISHHQGSLLRAHTYDVGAEDPGIVSFTCQDDGVTRGSDNTWPHPVIPHSPAICEERTNPYSDSDSTAHPLEKFIEGDEDRIFTSVYDVNLASAGEVAEDSNKKPELNMETDNDDCKVHESVEDEGVWKPEVRILEEKKKMCSSPTQEITNIEESFRTNENQDAVSEDKNIYLPPTPEAHADNPGKDDASSPPQDNLALQIPTIQERNASSGDRIDEGSFDKANSDAMQCLVSVEHSQQLNLEVPIDYTDKVEKNQIVESSVDEIIPEMKKSSVTMFPVDRTVQASRCESPARAILGTGANISKGIVKQESFGGTNLTEMLDPQDKNCAEKSPELLSSVESVIRTSEVENRESATLWEGQ